jgi:hypothetical protein
VCSIDINKTADGVLARQSDKDKNMIERRLVQFAREASIDVRSGLDIAPIKRMPPNLREARKITIGRHRVYYTGHHTQCSYTTFFIKEFKKTGVNDEDDIRFQKILIRAIGDRDTRPLSIDN